MARTTELPTLVLPGGAGGKAGPPTSLSQRRAMRHGLCPGKLTLETSRDQGAARKEAAQAEASFANSYSVVCAVGQGATASVERAVRRSDGRQVALKTVRTEDPQMVAMARREFDLLRGLAHPSIVRALDFVEAPGRAILVLELVEGRDLLETLGSLPDRRLPQHVAMPLVQQLVAAVACLHAEGVMHRDIKPENVLISHDLKTLKLVDFNVARSFQHGFALTPTGTRLYAAPEVVLGESPSESSDIWGIGLCAYLMLCGKLPQGRDRCESHGKPLSTRVLREVSTQGPGWAQVSEPCKAVVHQCLAREPSERVLPTASSLEWRGISGLAGWCAETVCSPPSSTSPVGVLASPRLLPPAREVPRGDETVDNESCLSRRVSIGQFQSTMMCYGSRMADKGSSAGRAGSRSNSRSASRSSAFASTSPGSSCTQESAPAGDWLSTSEHALEGLPM